MERHHPAGRRKAAFCFTVMLHSQCHAWVHANPAQATLEGLLWNGRNSKAFTVADASLLVGLMKAKPDYPVPILKRIHEAI